jgi:hypothetical protein
VLQVFGAEKGFMDSDMNPKHARQVAAETGSSDTGSGADSGAIAVPLPPPPPQLQQEAGAAAPAGSDFWSGSDGGGSSGSRATSGISGNDYSVGLRDSIKTLMGATALAQSEYCTHNGGVSTTSKLHAQ